MKHWILGFVLVIALSAAAAWRKPLVRWFTLASPTTTSASASPGAGGPASLTAGPFTVTLSTALSTLQVGTNPVTVTVRDAATAITGAQVTITAVMPAMGSMVEMRSTAPMTAAGEGRYEGILPLAMAGTWILHLDVQSDGRHGHADIEVTTGTPLQAPSSSAPQVAYYTCSMHPSVRSKAPGSCPICGMDLVPVTTADLSQGTIMVDAERRQRIGVTTAPVTVRETAIDIRAAGTIAPAEPRLHDITLRATGWIEELDADFLGKSVQSGQPLFTVYSPELLTAESDFLQALRVQGESPTLASAARQRLERWGMAPAQIDALARRGTPSSEVPILSPITGVVIAKDVVAGSAIAAGARVLQLADLSEVWLEAAVYQDEVGEVATGMPVVVAIEGFPGKHWDGHIAFIAPVVDATTRTVQVRVSLANPRLRVKPGMFAIAHLHVPLGKRLVVPMDAVIRAGDTAVVFLDLGEGRLKPQHVTIGHETMDGVEILTGLQVGDVVVTRGAFLLAAESRLKSGMAAW